MPSKLKKAIGAVKDQTSISLAKVSTHNSSNLEVVVLKATTHDDVPVEERYVYEVLHLISSNKIYAAACARAIGKRIGRTRNWIVALKSLMLVLRIFQDGDPYFPREVLHTMKRGAKILNLSNFRDDSNSSPWDYTAFVRTFALYLDERLDCFLTGKLQRRYTHKERESFHSSRSSRRANEPVREMKPNMLLDKIIYWQRLLERAMGTRPTGQAKTNRLVQVSLYSVVKETFDLYKDISDGLALLLDSFFHLQYQSCVSAFQICVKAAKQFEELSSFYSLCKNIGVGRTSEYPSVQSISEELIETLQEFLKDQSSFSANMRSPSRPLLLAAPDGSSSRQHESYGGRLEFSSYGGRSEFSEMSTERYSERTSEIGSQRTTSLEELISATETGRSPSISIDLEAYSDQFEKKSQRDEPFRVSDTGSTRSLPVSTSLVDLVSLEDWPENDEESKEQKGQEQERREDRVQPGSVWELVLPDTMPTPMQTLPNSTSFDPFPSQELKQPLPNSTSFDPFPNQELEQPLPNSSCFDPFPKPEQAFPNPNSSNPSSKQEKSSMPSSSSFDPFPKPDQSFLSSSQLDPFQTQEQEQSLPIKMDTFDAFPSQDLEQNQQETGVGWELVLFETATQQSQETGIIASTFDASSLDSLYGQAPVQSHHYNPFLQDSAEYSAPESIRSLTKNEVVIEEVFPAIDELPSEPTFQATAPTFQATMPTFQASSPEPTFPTTLPTFQASLPASTSPASLQMFQATPTFSAKSHVPEASSQNAIQNTNNAMAVQETDPFASVFSSGQMFNGAMNQQDLLHQQQLWLQQQNKIIAKHMA